jgi:hypothetical protein
MAVKIITSVNVVVDAEPIKKAPAKKKSAKKKEEK